MTRTSSPPSHENKDWERDGRCIEYYPNRGFRISPDPVSVVFNTQQRLRSKATYTVINYWHLAWVAKAQCLLACQDCFVTETPLLKSPKSEYSCRSGGYHCARVCTSQHIHYPRMLLSTIQHIHYPRMLLSTIQHIHYPRMLLSTIQHIHYPRMLLSTIQHIHYPRMLLSTIQHIHYPRMLLSTIQHIHYPRMLLSTIQHIHYPRMLLSTILRCYYPLSSISTILRCYYPLSSTHRCGETAPHATFSRNIGSASLF